MHLFNSSHIICENGVGLVPDGDRSDIYRLYAECWTGGAEVVKWLAVNSRGVGI